MGTDARVNSNGTVYHYIAWNEVHGRTLQDLLTKCRNPPRKIPVEHALLIAHLETFDAWALSCSSPSLPRILPLCPEDIRVMAWVKPFASFKKDVNPAYAWEPVIVCAPMLASGSMATC